MYPIRGRQIHGLTREAPDSEGQAYMPGGSQSRDVGKGGFVIVLERENGVVFGSRRKLTVEQAVEQACGTCVNRWPRLRRPWPERRVQAHQVHLPNQPHQTQ